MCTLRVGGAGEGRKRQQGEKQRLGKMPERGARHWGGVEGFFIGDGVFLDAAPVCDAMSWIK